MPVLRSIWTFAWQPLDGVTHIASTCVLNLVKHGNIVQEKLYVESLKSEKMNSAWDGKEEFESPDKYRKCHTSAFDIASPMLEEMLTYLQSMNITVDYFVQEWNKRFKASDESSQYGISKIGEAFMSGVLDHLPAVLAYTAPHPTSYERLFSTDWNGRVVSWQKENRYAKNSTCRQPGADVVSHFVCPAFDACSNPYLGLASILTAGIDGLRKNLSLPAPIEKYIKADDEISLSIKEIIHIISDILLAFFVKQIDSPVNQEDYRRLPDCLTESLNALEEDTLFNNMMGENLVVCIKAIRKAEINHYSEDDEPYKDLIHKY
ncbi:hypothetical protein RND71_030788 [Anisodus tanguticus]|uniref:GS catalytic domain-containing protein n=1 Tax=Anisodus tanguticus TaxID=243964 RepID=A0AAE1V8L0_9SOLA|nr:hypothetical protein RND71_030788 [Anisodus tanguticus]